MTQRYRVSNKDPNLAPARYQIETLQEMVNVVKLTNVKRRLTNFIETFDLRLCKNQEDIAAGYQGIFELILYLGVHGKDIRDTCELLLKALNGYASHRKGYLEVEFPKEIEARMDQQMDGLLKAIQQVVKPDEYKKIIALMGIDSDNATPQIEANI